MKESVKEQSQGELSKERNLSFLGYSNYIINTKGEVYSLFSGRYLKGSISDKGYHLVDLRGEAKRRNYPIHRLVALSFIENKERKPQVNHIDGDKTNNNKEDLEWCTATENLVHAYKLKLNTRQRKVVRLCNGIPIQTYESISQACRVLGVHTANIVKVCLGKRKTTGGFGWKYA